MQGLKPEHASPPGVNPSGLRRAKALPCHVHGMAPKRPSEVIRGHHPCRCGSTTPKRSRVLESRGQQGIGVPFPSRVPPTTVPPPHLPISPSPHDFHRFSPHPLTNGKHVLY